MRHFVVRQGEVWAQLIVTLQVLQERGHQPEANVHGAIRWVGSVILVIRLKLLPQLQQHAWRQLDPLSVVRMALFEPAFVIFVTAPGIAFCGLTHTCRPTTVWARVPFAVAVHLGVVIHVLF